MTSRNRIVRMALNALARNASGADVAKAVDWIRKHPELSADLKEMFGSDIRRQAEGLLKDGAGEFESTMLALTNSAAQNKVVQTALNSTAYNASPDGDERSMALVKENLVKLSHFIDDAYETARESQKTREMIEYVVSRMSPDGKAAAAKEIRNTLSAFQREISFMTGPWYRVKA